MQVGCCHGIERWLYTVPVSEAGLCVTHWASGSRFAANYIRLTFSRVWWHDFLGRPSLAFVWSGQGFLRMVLSINWLRGFLRGTSKHRRGQKILPVCCLFSQYSLSKCSSREENTVQTLKMNRALCRISCTVRWYPTPAINNNLATTINKLRQLAQVVVHVWTPCVNPLHSHPSFPPIWNV